MSGTEQNVMQYKQVMVVDMGYASKGVLDFIREPELAGGITHQRVSPDISIPSPQEPLSVPIDIDLK